MAEYTASKTRYTETEGTDFYRHCGKSGLMLPPIALGLWHNFGSVDNYENMKQMCFTAFDHGITHLIWQIITVRYMEAQRKTSAESSGKK